MNGGAMDEIQDWGDEEGTRGQCMKHKGNEKRTRSGDGGDG